MCGLRPKAVLEDSTSERGDGATANPHQQAARIQAVSRESVYRDFASHQRLHTDQHISLIEVKENPQYTSDAPA